MPPTSPSSAARELFTLYDQFMQPDIRSRRFTQSQMVAWLTPLCDSAVMKCSAAGQSAEGRAINLYSVGTGPVRVLLWSQMHGDEPTATMALVDLCRFLTIHREHPVASAIRTRLTLQLVPMLNPDGAERFTRRTAQMIDMNRDALVLVAPESRILKRLQEQYKPDYAFNLHDQDRHYTVGTSRKVTAIALLAPATNDEKTDDVVRRRAKRVAAVLAGVLGEFVPGHVAKWDDTFEPRAFGDNVQRWGTSTVLLESGWWPDDPEKMFLRKLNCVGLLTALYSIAVGISETTDPAAYEAIPFNTKFLFDIIYRNATLQMTASVAPVRVDVGVNVEEVRDDSTGAIRRMASIQDIGDLSVYSGLREFDMRGRRIEPSRIRLETPFSAEELASIFGN